MNSSVEKEGQNNNQKNQAGLFVFRKRFVFDRFTLQVNLGDKSGGV